jgi:predicted transcriptional regulator
MARPQAKHPTELELEILKVLWAKGPLTGREVRDALAEAARDLAYTSVMTIMGIMEDKGYLRRKKQGNGFIYSARIAEKATLRRMLRDLVQRAYDGSVMAAMVNLLEESDMDADELKQLRQLLNHKTEEMGE